MLLINDHKALGTLWWIELFHGDVDPALAGTVVKLINDFEKLYSRFDPDSFVGKLNRTGSFKEPSDEFIALLQIGIDLYKSSNGQFNFLLGKTLEDRGYDKDLTFDVKSVRSEIPDISALELSEKLITLDLSTGARVDLGGFGKGFLIGKISKLLHNEGYEYHLINGGGDIYASSDQGKPVQVLIRNPLNKNFAIGRIFIKEEAFCGSSILERSWKGKGSDDIFSHIIDPGDSKRLPAGTVYLLYEDVVQTDAFSTTLSFRFEDREYLDRLEKDGYKYMIITKEKLIRSANFPKLK